MLGSPFRAPRLAEHWLANWPLTPCTLIGAKHQRSQAGASPGAGGLPRLSSGEFPLSSWTKAHTGDWVRPVPLSPLLISRLLIRGKMRETGSLLAH